MVDHGGDDDDGGAAHELRREVPGGQSGRVHRGGDEAVEHYRSGSGESLMKFKINCGFILLGILSTKRYPRLQYLEDVVGVLDHRRHQ